jgi:cellulose synthase/poly-beta-1,6-N-acetylglucosamine synthase-like glycosyltransferase
VAAREGVVSLETALHAAVLACTAYLCVLYVFYVSLMAVGLVETRRRRRERAVDDVDALAVSRFAPGVSVIVPAYNESGGLPDAVRSLLAMDYPEFEVIVVNDGSTDQTLERLVEELGLVPVEEASRDIVVCHPPLGYYRSPSDPRLLVVDKANGGKADGLNAGLNHCRYRYVCGVDADMVFARDALTRAMREIASDPRVVGLTSYFENARDPVGSLVEGRHYAGPDATPIFAFQTFDYLRAFFNNRTPWARLNFMLCAAGAFQIWRRDLVEELEGWSAEFTCEDIEFTFRAHRVLRERGRDYRIACLPDCVGVTEGPDSVRNLVSQRERWQRVILETCWANRRMWLNPRYGTVGMLGVPFYLLSEIVAPVFELLAVTTLAVGGIAGLIDWWEFAVLTLLVTFANSALTTGALLMLDLEARAYRAAGIARLLALMPLEMIVYRPVMAWARVKGTWRFFRGDRGWHKFERNVRADAT